MSKLPGFIWLILGLGLIVFFFNMGGAHVFGSLFSNSLFSNGSSTSSSPSFSNFFSFLKPLARPYQSSTYVPPVSRGGTMGSGSTGSSIAPYEIPKGFTAAQLSPNFHKIRFGGVGTQQISLFTAAAYGQVTSTVDITGWQIKTNRGGEFIPQVTNIYDPSGAPLLSDIVLALNKSQSVYFYSNSSPVNLRLNKCLGYLNQPNQFNPQFPGNCPYIDRSSISSFTGACQNYVQSLGSCQPADLSSPYFPRNDYQCEQYLTNNFTYRSCVTTHRTDADFLGNEWRVWMGHSPLDQFHDNVELLDRNGLLVDYYSY
jgi:hypothetical protein